MDSDYVTQFQCSREELATLGLNAPISVIEDPVRYDSGYVQSVTIDGVSFSGREIRETLQRNPAVLPSLWTAIRSPYGQRVWPWCRHVTGRAQGMALEGYGYEEILQHYYTGIQFADVYKS
ncbi:MAG: hypothetical protein ACLVJ6_05685 [Merdibacter sp.]